MIKNLIIKVIKENIKKGKYYTFDDKVISQNICIEDYLIILVLKLEFILMKIL